MGSRGNQGGMGQLVAMGDESLHIGAGEVALAQTLADQRQHVVRARRLARAKAHDHSRFA